VEEPAPEVLIVDAGRPAIVRLAYDEGLGCIQVGLDDPPQIRVTGLVYPEFMRELAGYFRDLARCPPTRGEELRRVSSFDKELCVEAWADAPGIVGLGVSLAEEMWDPHWVVRVNLLVASAELSRVAASLERLSLYADGLPQGPDAEQDPAADGGA
jgi:hypothetical protein